MTQILNVPMPADEAIKIIRAMFDSNRMISVALHIDREATQRENAKSYDYKYEYNSVLELEIGTITINSITPLIPTYSVWQEVMILATGEIGTVHELFKWNNKSWVVGITVNLWWYTNDCFLNEVCKIA